MADSEVRQKELMTLELKAMIRNIETFRTSLPDKLRIMQRFYDAVFEAGMRAGEIAMREKAANCAAEVYLGRHDALDIAQMIRALPAAPEEKKKRDPRMA